MLKRIAPIALGVAMLAVASVQSYAFMVATDEVPTPATIDLVEMVEVLEAELQAEDINCESMLAKLDAALENIDGALDSGVEDEANHLAARDALIDMRLSLPCLGEALVHDDGTPIFDGGIIDGGIIDGGIIDGGIIDGGIIDGGFVNGGYSSGGFASGGGGAAAAGGGGGGLLLLGGAAAAIAIPLASSDDDDPGQPATTMAN